LRAQRLILRQFKEFTNDFCRTFLLSALITVVVTSILFGLPMAYLAYKKDIETAIGFHWIIDAVRFTLGV
jgi:ABC-type spermidine/putrescine transport system permease subunit I